MPDDYLVSINSIARGGLVERFDNALGQVVDNILDPNTKADQAREIVIKVKIVPNETRSMAAVTVGCETKLAPPRSLDTSLYIGTRNGQPAATEYNPDQPSIFDLEKDFGNVNDRDNKRRSAGDTD